MIALLLMLCGAQAGTLEDAQNAELERLRREVADQVHLSAFDLIDELVWSWTQDPVFDSATPVVLAGLTVPVGLGSGMQALMENHLADVLTHNSTSNLQLVHCPMCSAVTVHSGPEGTIVSRGIDNPDTLAALGDDTGKHALFIDVEAEGAWLVLRARITKLDPDLPIVWSHTIASSSSTPSLLRDPHHLKSAEDARKEYLQALKGGAPISIPVRVAVRTYAKPEGTTAVGPPPFLWLQSGAEFGTKTRAWTASLIVGYSFIPQAYQGLMGQARLHRLLTGRVRSRTRPDLYLFIGGAAMTVWGPATAPFINQPLNADDIIAGINMEGPRTAFGTFHAGLDLRLGNRVGFSAFLESIPDLNNSQNVGDYVRPLGLGFQTLGVEVALWF